MGGGSPLVCYSSNNIPWCLAGSLKMWRQPASTWTCGEWQHPSDPRTLPQGVLPPGIQSTPFLKAHKPAGNPFPHHCLWSTDVTCASRESPGWPCPGRAGPKPWFNSWRESKAGRFGLGLGVASVLTLPCSCTFPSPPPLQLPALFFPHLDLFPPFPGVGFASCPRRDSDVVESMRHKLGELTDLHGLKRLVLLRKEG